MKDSQSDIVKPGHPRELQKFLPPEPLPQLGATTSATSSGILHLYNNLHVKMGSPAPPAASHIVHVWVLGPPLALRHNSHLDHYMCLPRGQKSSQSHPPKSHPSASEWLHHFLQFTFRTSAARESGRWVCMCAWGWGACMQCRTTREDENGGLLNAKHPSTITLIKKVV